MAPRNHAACVGSYCDAILSGEIIAGRYVELAVRRYFEHAHERGLVGFFSSSDSTGGSVDTVDEDGPWDETDPMFYEMHDDAMDF